MLIYILVGIVMFGLLVAVHEGGHFLAAKLLDVQVNEFAIGMGPKLFSRQIGETVYSLRLFPIGGFCAMEGEDGYDDDEYEYDDDEEEEPEETDSEPVSPEDDEDREEYNPRAFSAKAPWKRLVILAAGPGANLIAGFLIAVFLFSAAGSYTVPMIAELMDGVACAGEDGLLPGDRIVSIDGTRMFVGSDVIAALNQAGDTVDMVIRRDGRTLERPGLFLPLREYEYEGQTRLLRGLTLTREDAAFPGVLRFAGDTCLSFSVAIRDSLRMLVHGEVTMQDMSGPVGIVSFLGEAGSSAGSLAGGMFNVFYICALVAVNLAIMNLLPFPALDGGRIFLLLVGELVYLLTRHRIPPRYEAWINIAGLVLLMLLMLVLTVSDVGKLIR